ncbi:hypothetical protein EJ08DRAFT_194763 [Tothia fuscella]|uniref:Aminoglycoside phosphotransferase domain-containing protein n=1 Tax=Tothia fuscella TaxID=1048955 RepID=A0A9P4NSD0_9PEZI|nr:hypothetical protein EJ08DRAFT_194763 [Tothia fuscella]
MQSQQNIENVASELLATQNLKLVSGKSLQSLWAGYGHICQLKVLPSVTTGLSQQRPISLILKYISPPTTKPDQLHTESHLRKVLSYHIEQYFYTHLAPQMPPEIAVAKCFSSIGSKADSTATAMIMTDLREAFPIAGEKRSELSEKQVCATIDWLASFHGFWWKRVKSFDRAKLCLPPLEHFKKTHTTVADEGVWLNGGYTYYATRLDEFGDLCQSESEWRGPLCGGLSSEDGAASLASIVAKFLAPTISGERHVLDYETLIHGDVKSENLFTTASGDAVAFFDFQYVGLGLGVCDLAKLFTCSVPQESLEEDVAEEMGMGIGEEKLLRYYLDKLKSVSGKDYDWNVFVRHWETALVDWLRFQASWGFWGNTDWLEGRVRRILKDEGWIAYVKSV